MATEADLIARIVADPDDRDGFLVYGDWLLERNDRRGQLIALHAAGRTAEAEQLFVEERIELLGPLGALAATQVELEWHLGFVRCARVHAPWSDAAIATLGVVVSAPACRFLRRLEVHIRTQDYAPIDAALAGFGRCSGVAPTLDALVLGEPGEHVPSDALLAAFPRLAPRGDRWGDIAGALATLDELAMPFDPAQLPALADVSGQRIPESPAALLRGLVADTGFTLDASLACRVGVVAMLRASCPADAVDAYAAALAAQWLAHLFDPIATRLADVVATLAGPRTARVLGRALGASSGSLAVEPAAEDEIRRAASHWLSVFETPLACLELFHAARHGQLERHHTGRYVAERAHRASRTPQSLLARLGSDDGDLRDEPAARFAEIDLEVIEHLITTGWTTSLHEALELFVRAPRAARASGLVWGTARGPTRRRLPREPIQLETAPCFLTDIGPVDRDGGALAIEPDELIWLVHPGELAPDELAAWRAAQHARRAVVRQLDRRLPLAGAPVTLDALRAKLGKLPRPEILQMRGFEVPDPTDPITPQAPPLATRGYLYRNVLYRVEIDAHRHVRAHPEPPPVVIHELARDLLEAS